MQILDSYKYIFFASINVKTMSVKVLLQQWDSLSKTNIKLNACEWTNREHHVGMKCRQNENSGRIPHSTPVKRRQKVCIVMCETQ